MPSFLTQPWDDPAIFGELEDRESTPLLRLYRLLGFWNGCLLPPMVTLIVVELLVGQSVHKLLHDEALLVGFCVFFALEWTVGLALARSKKSYLRNLWLGLDLLSSIPFGFLFQAGRLARISRVGKLFRLGSYARATKLLRLRRLKIDVLRFSRAAVILLSVAASGAVAIRAIEPETVSTASDAFWWSLVTISTVGYGDIYPTTEPGRVVGMVLIVFGIGVYGYVAGLTTDAVTHPEDTREHLETLDAIARLEAKVTELTAMIEQDRSGPD